MITLEMAKRLKVAGLKQPEINEDWIHAGLFGKAVLCTKSGEIRVFQSDTWIPTLSQLLAEIERGGYKNFRLDHSEPDKLWRFLIFADLWPSFTADSPDDAVAQGVGWTLERRNNA